MQRKIIPVAILLMILAIISLPSHSNEYTGKAIHQRAIKQQGLFLPTQAPEAVECSYTDSPISILLSL